MRRSIVGLSLVAPALVGVLASGCGNSGEATKSASQIWGDARSATLGAHSVHYMTALPSEHLKVSMSANDKGSQGTLDEALGPREVLAGGRTYLKAPKQFWEQQLRAKPAQAIKLAGKWIVASGSAGGLGSTTVHSLASLMFPAKHKSIRKEGTTTMSGQKAVKLAVGGDTLYVADTGTPYPIRVIKGAETLTFGAWNQPVHVRPPAHARTIRSVLGSG